MDNNDNVFNKIGSLVYDNEDFLKELKKPTIPQINWDGINSELIASQEKTAKIQEEKEQRELEYKESVLNTLQGIEKNTALLTEMTLLLQKSNAKQDEMFQLMIEIMEIMKSTDKEEAGGKFTEVMKKITTVTDSASTIQSLASMATTVYNALPF